MFGKAHWLNRHGTLTSLKSPLVMGILNVTPDSFYDGGKYVNDIQIKKRIDTMVSQGVDIIDVGAYSSRPGADHISADEETKRLRPVLDLFAQYYPDVVVSVDTFRSDVAAFALKNYHVSMINDISGGDLDEAMVEVVAKYKAVYVAMHMQGTPQNMQENPTYNDRVTDVMKLLQNKIVRLEKSGVKDVIIDPGFGFGKTLDDNYSLLTNLKAFNLLNKPILVGISRKSMLYNLLGTDAALALNATTAAHMRALLNGADILRAHDVKEAWECIRVFNKLSVFEGMGSVTLG